MKRSILCTVGLVSTFAGLAYGAAVIIGDDEKALEIVPMGSQRGN